MNGRTALHRQIYNRRAQVTFATALPENLVSRLRGNDVRAVELEVINRGRKKKPSVHAGFRNQVRFDEILVERYAQPRAVGHGHPAVNGLHLLHRQLVP